jgi:hypothetical protein
MEAKRISKNFEEKQEFLDTRTVNNATYYYIHENLEGTQYREFKEREMIKDFISQREMAHE